MLKPQFCLLTVSLLLVLPMCHGGVWQFQRSSNFRQPSNWRGGSPPCSRDTVRLPSTPALIGLTPPVLVQRELIFSNSGDSALVLFEGSGLRAFHEFDAALSDPSHCQDISRIRDLEFNFTKAMDWFHPGNWEMKPSTNPAESAFNFDALPVDRIPGPCDAVHFDENSTYLVKVLDRGSQLSVGQLQIAGKIFDNQAEDNVLSQSADRLNEFWTKSDLPKRQFEHSDGGYANEVPFSIADTAANGLGDMPLPVRHPALMSRVCSGLSTSDDRATTCSDPIPAAEVIGGCSTLCGGIVLSLRALSAEFSLQQLRNDLQQQLRSSRMFIRMSVIRTSISEPMYQLVLMRNDSNAAASTDAAKMSLFDLLQWLRTNASLKKFQIVKTTMSGELTKSFAQFQNGSAYQAASIHSRFGRFLRCTHSSSGGCGTRFCGSQARLDPGSGLAASGPVVAGVASAATHESAGGAATRSDEDGTGCCSCDWGALFHLHWQSGLHVGHGRAAHGPGVQQSGVLARGGHSTRFAVSVCSRRAAGGRSRALKT